MQAPPYPQPGYTPPPAGATPPPGQYGTQPPQGYPPQGYPQGYAAPVAAPPAAPAKKSGVPVIVWILGGVLLFLIVACLAVFWLVNNIIRQAELGVTDFGNTASASINASLFDLSMSTGSYESAHEYLGGNLATRYSVQDLQDRWEALEGSGGAFSVKSDMGEPKASGNQVLIDWKVTPENGSTKTVTLTMEERDNDWKIVDAKPDLIPSP